MTEEVTIRTQTQDVAENVEPRKDYTQAERDKAAKEGAALSDGSFPIYSQADAENAWRLRNNGDHAEASVVAHIKKRVKALGLKMPSDDDSRAQAKDCSTCDGTGKIMDGNRKCPDCNGTGSLANDGSAPEQRTPLRARKPGRKERHRAVPLIPEVRHYNATDLEVRSVRDSDEIIITGSAIVYDSPYVVRDIFGEFEERMMPGCVADLLNRGVDCRLLLNHEGLAMARTTARTLTLADTPRSLNIEARLDARQHLANDFAIAVERGDMNQMSVGMVVSLDEWGDNGTLETRDVYKLDNLLDVSGVTYPCSPSTNLAVAQRMAMEMPVESRARVRRLYADVRAGKVLSDTNQGKIVEAAKAIHTVLSASGFDPSSLIEADDSAEPDAAGTLNEDASVGGDVENGEGSSTDAADGSGDLSGSLRQEDPGEKIRDDEPVAAERRDDPTPEDHGIAWGLKDLKAQIAQVKARQLADPDNATDPDDKAVMEAISAAEAAIDKAIVAQSKDGHADSRSKTLTALRIRAEAHKLRVL